MNQIKEWITLVKCILVGGSPVLMLVLLFGPQKDPLSVFLIVVFWQHCRVQNGWTGWVASWLTSIFAFVGVYFLGLRHGKATSEVNEFSYVVAP